MKVEGNLMFSQRNNPYCDLLSKLCCKFNGFIFVGKIFFVKFTAEIKSFYYEKNIRT